MYPTNPTQPNNRTQVHKEKDMTSPSQPATTYVYTIDYDIAPPVIVLSPLSELVEAFTPDMAGASFDERHAAAIKNKYFPEYFLSYQDAVEDMTATLERDALHPCPECGNVDNQHYIYDKDICVCASCGASFDA